MSLSDPVPQRIGRYFDVESTLGSGGTSRVLQVVDRRTGERLALKQALQTLPSQRSRGHALFRQEFHVLSRISHPNVVKVYEYGFDAGRPFYTMEWVRGRSLGELAPLTWQRLCEVLVDLCSPLSMLHARRFVHGDVTARNVLVTEEGRTKLIDFGALTALDRPATTIAGTPPHMAPELVRKQSIDGRVDMFALGALAYSTLAGRHAYPARTIQELPQVWAQAPATLTELGVSVPRELDHLIMSLLSLDPGARPLQLAELVSRLCAIASALETPLLQAQLATPRLVGRAGALDQFRQMHQATLGGQGGVICFAGAEGMGCSRVLEACALEAIHGGSRLVHVSAAELVSAPWALLAQLLLSACAHDSGLVELLPTSIGAAVSAAPADCAALAALLNERPALEIEQSLRALCAQRSAVVLIDELARADVPSIQACLGLDVSKSRLLLVTSVGRTGGALEREVAALVSSRRTISLTPLTERQTGELVASLFGDGAELGPLGSWIYRAGLGVPGASVELARHALEQGYVRYVQGRFQITQDVEAGRIALPRALDKALSSAVERLLEPAREVLGVLALLTPCGPLTTVEQIELLCTGGASQADVLDSFDQLCDAQLLSLIGETYELRWRGAAALSAQDVRRWQLRIARFYEQRGHDSTLVSASHYEAAGELATACEKAIAMEAQMRGPDDPNIRFGGSPAGVAFHQRMLDYAIESGRPRVDVLGLRRVLVSIGATAAPTLRSHGPLLLAGLGDDVGLSFLAQADPSLSDHDKLVFGLSRAQERFAQAPAGERLAPLDAIRHFASAVGALSSMNASACDGPAAAALVESFRPLRSLAPVLDFTYQLVETTAGLLRRGGMHTARWRALLGLIGESSLGLPDLIWKYMLSAMHFSLGRDLAQLADPQALHHAQVLSEQRRTQMQACSVRLMYALALGDHKSAAEQRHKRAVAGLASRHEDQRLASSYVTEIALLDACGDLLELQTLTAWFEARVAWAPRAAPIADYARACGYVLCGRLPEAEQLIEAQLTAAPVLEHFMWYPLRALRAELALLRGEARLAKQMAEEVLRVAAEAEVDMRPDTRAERVLALALAALGDTGAATAVLDPMLDALSGDPAARSVRAGQLHEARARVALLAQDIDAFRLHHAEVQAVYAQHGHPGLMAKLQRLSSAWTQSQANQTSAHSHTQRLTTIQTELSGLERREQREYLLGMLIRDAQTRSGYLYELLPDQGAQCVASHQAAQNDAKLDAQVAAYIERMNAWADERTRSICLDTELAITREQRETGLEHEQFTVAALRDTQGQLQAVALLLATAATGAQIRTDGLCTLVADMLAQLRRLRP